MKSALNKDFVRDIKNSKGRFISILLIVALGVAFFAGIKDAPLVMKKTSDSYYDDSNLMDIRITSTLGLTDDDVDAIKKINKVDGIKGTYSMEAISNYKDKDSVVQIQSINLSDYKQNNKNYMNRQRDFYILCKSIRKGAVPCPNHSIPPVYAFQRSIIW